MLEQSRTYFERCHAADLDPEVPVAEKEECWALWLDRYTAGQAPEVVAYATKRQRALARGETLPPLPGMGGDAEPALQSIGPAPESSADGGAEGDRVHSASEDRPGLACGGSPEPGPPRCPSPPGVDVGPCADVCNPRWYRCASQCVEPDSRCLEACEIEHRTCMGGCY